MSAYAVFTYTITDPDAFASYPAAAMPSIGESGAEILVADYNSDQLEGEPDQVTIVLRFPDKAAARAWYDGATYADAKPLRLAATTGSARLCDGFGS